MPEIFAGVVVLISAIVLKLRLGWPWRLLCVVGLLVSLMAIDLGPRKPDEKVRNPVPVLFLP